MSLSINQQPVAVIPDEVDCQEWVSRLTKSQMGKGEDDSFYVLSVSQLLARHRSWTSLLPRVHAHYAVKANPDPVMLQLLGWLGLGFDCASKGEITSVLKLGISPNRVIYANTCKSVSFIRYARSAQVLQMTFDNEEELHKIKIHFPEAKLILRIHIIDPSAFVKLNSKFGCPIEAAKHLLTKAQKMQLLVVGISFHVGGMSQNPYIYSQGIFEARRLFDFAKHELGYEMSVLDVGGGFPGVDSDVIKFEDIAAAINQALDDHFLDSTDLKIVAEPGRFYAMLPCSLFASVIAINKVPAAQISDDEEVSGEGFMYYCSDGVFLSFNCVPCYDCRPPFYILDHNLETQHDKYWSRIWGPTCDSADLLFPKIQLPKLSVGDWLVFDFMGAYCRCIASNFNGFEIPKVFYYVCESDSKTVLNLMENQTKLELNENVEKKQSA